MPLSSRPFDFLALLSGPRASATSRGEGNKGHTLDPPRQDPIASPEPVSEAAKAPAPCARSPEAGPQEKQWPPRLLRHALEAQKQVHDCQEEQQWPPRLLRHASGAQKQASKHQWQSESATLGRACPLVILIHRHHKNSSLLAHRGAAKAPAPRAGSPEAGP